MPKDEFRIPNAECRTSKPTWLATAVVLCAVLFGIRPSAFGIADSQQPVYKSTADVVEVDAIVTDRSGRFVRDLRLDEIEILEDGKLQRLGALYLVDRGVAMEASAGAPARDTAQDAGTPIRRAFFFLFDQEHLTPGALNRVRTGVERFISTEFRDGHDLASLYAMGASGQVRMTSEREELLRSVRGIRFRGDVAARLADFRDWPRIVNDVEALRIDQEDTAVLNTAAMRACAEEPVRNCLDQAEMLLRKKARRFARDAESSVNRTLQALTAAASGLARLDGRKTLVFMTEGFFPDSQRAVLRTVTGAAGRAGVAIYVVDARGLDKSSPGSVQETAPADTFASNAFDTREDPGDELANGTGGLVIRNVNDGAKAMAAIAADTGTYYVIGYIPDDTTLDGRFRPIEVRVKREGVVVRARRGYVASPRVTPLIAGPRVTTSAPGTDPAPGTRTPSHEAPGTTHPAPGTLPSTSMISAAPLPAARPNAGMRVQELINLSNRVAPSASANEAAARGWSLYEKGDLEGAARELTEASASPAAPAWAFYALGQAEFGLRRFGDAVTRWEHVRSMVPEFEPVYFDLVDGYLQLDRARDAIAVLRAAERRWPADADVYNALGVIQVRRGALDDAVESFGKAIKAQPASALGYFNLGRAHEMRYARSRRYMPTTGGWIGGGDDRRNAIANYQKYVELGGPFEHSAKEGLARLEWK
jgi:VWFA-related protein